MLTKLCTQTNTAADVRNKHACMLHTYLKSFVWYVHARLRAVLSCLSLFILTPDSRSSDQKQMFLRARSRGLMEILIQTQLCVCTPAGPCVCDRGTYANSRRWRLLDGEQFHLYRLCADSRGILRTAALSWGVSPHSRQMPARIDIQID